MNSPEQPIDSPEQPIDSPEQPIDSPEQPIDSPEPPSAQIKPKKLQEGFMKDEWTRFKTSVDGINTNISKVNDIQQQMMLLSSKGFNVGPSIDCLEIQKKQYSDFLQDTLAKFEELIKTCEEMALKHSS